ncbi:MAG: hypothetical protein J0H23_13245 [Micrococcales bacterium]|nr:hypothetical protein [Micrococcales bacterium]OJX69120.1 MAG: hypothetical protein BGO94_11185 [Micrococcales bacterium 72-143]
MVTERMSWWRRSRWALLSLLVLVPAAVAASLSIDAFDYLSSRPSDVTTLDRGEQASLGDATIRVVDSWSAVGGSPEGDRYEVPDGTALVSVTLELDASAAPEGFTCTTKLLEPGVDRRWSSGLAGVDYFPGEGLPDDVPSGCSRADMPFPFELAFLIPDDAVDDVVLEVFTSDLLPRAYHLRLS